MIRLMLQNVSEINPKFKQNSKMQEITFDNYQFHYLEAGNGVKIIFIHGSASDVRIWKYQIETFGKKYHALAYSRRFHSPNQPIAPQEDYSMAQHVEDLKAFISHFGSNPVHLVGHSYGALVVLELARRNPELIKSLILAEPPAIRLFISNTPKPAELLKLLFTRPKTALAIIKLGARGLGPASKAAKQGDMSSAFELFGKVVLGKKTYASLTEKRKKQALDNLTPQEFLGSGFLPISDQAIKNMHFPVLLLTAENSPKVFHYLADRLAELLPRVQRAIIANASHNMMEGNPDEFNRKLEDFLLQQRG